MGHNITHESLMQVSKRAHCSLTREYTIVCVPVQLLELDRLVLYWKCPIRVAFSKLNLEIICSPTLVPASNSTWGLQISISYLKLV